MKRMFCLLAVLLWAGSVTAQPSVLDSFTSLAACLSEGGRVKAVFHYARCTLVTEDGEKTAPDAVGGMNVDTWEYFAAGAVHNPKAFLAFSHTSLIDHPRYGFIYNYVKCRVHADERVEIIVKYLTPADYQTVMSETFTTVISGPEGGGGAVFFVRP